MVPEFSASIETGESSVEASESLQDAFRKRKSKFIKHSEERVRAAKEVRSQHSQTVAIPKSSEQLSKDTTTSSETDIYSPVPIVKEPRSETSDSPKLSGEYCIDVRADSYSDKD